MIKYLGLTFSMLLIIHCSLSQSEVRGVIISHANEEVIPFSTVGVIERQIGTISNADGSFILDPNLFEDDDKITVSALGYESKTIFFKELTSNPFNKIVLKEKVEMLDEIVITGDSYRRKRLRQLNLGNHLFNTGTMRLDNQKNGGTIALLIRHDANPMLISNLRLRIKYNSMPSFKVRGRILKVDPKTGKPGKDILEESVVIESSITKGWLEFDLSEYHLWIEEKEFYIAFEWIMDLEDRVILTTQLKRHLDGSPESISASRFDFGEIQVVEKKVSDFKEGIWFGTLLNFPLEKEYPCYYRLNSMDSWKKSAAILAATVSITDLN